MASFLALLSIMHTICISRDRTVISFLNHIVDNTRVEGDTNKNGGPGVYVKALNISHIYLRRRSMPTEGELVNLPGQIDTPPRRRSTKLEEQQQESQEVKMAYPWD